MQELYVNSLAHLILAEDQAAFVEGLSGITRETGFTQKSWGYLLTIIEQRINKNNDYKRALLRIFQNLLQKIVELATPETGLGLDQQTMLLVMRLLKRNTLDEYFKTIKNGQGYSFLYFLNNFPSYRVQENEYYGHITATSVEDYNDLVNAVSQDDIPALESLIKRGVNLNYTGELGQDRRESILSIALTQWINQTGSLRVVQCLLKHGAQMYLLENNQLQDLVSVLVPQKYHSYFKRHVFAQIPSDRCRDILGELKNIMCSGAGTFEEKDQAVIKLLEENGLYNKAKLIMLMRHRGILFNSVSKDVVKMITQYADTPNPVTPAVSAAAPQKNLRS